MECMYGGYWKYKIEDDIGICHRTAEISSYLARSMNIGSVAIKRFTKKLIQSNLVTFGMVRTFFTGDRLGFKIMSVHISPLQFDTCHSVKISNILTRIID